MTRVAILALGSALAVDCEDTAATALREAWAACALGADAEVDVVLAPAAPGDGADGQPTQTPAELASVALNGAALLRYEGLALHAGVVGDELRLLVIPGESGRGKTTLTAACVLAGLGYVSDEALCLDRRSGTVEGYPKPLGLSGASLALLGLEPALAGAAEALLPPGRLGTVLDPRGRRVTDVVDPHRRPGPPQLVELHRSEGVPLLLPRCFNHYRDAAGSFALLTDLARAARVWRLDYDEPLAAAALLRDAL